MKPEHISKRSFKKHGQTRGAQAGIGTFMVWPKTTDSERYIFYIPYEIPFIHIHVFARMCTYSLSAFLLIFLMIHFVFCHCIVMFMHLPLVVNVCAL